MNPVLKVYCILAAFIGWTSLSYFAGWHVKSVFDREAEEKKAASQAESVIVTERKQYQISNEVDHDYQLKTDALDALYDRAVERLRSPSTDPLPASSVTAAGPDAKACDHRFPGRSQERWLDLLKVCQKQAIQLDSLQKFIAKVSP